MAPFGICPIHYEDTESYQITKMFLDNRELMLKRLLAEDEEED